MPIEYILPFYCYHCERRFKSKPILKDHEEIHRDERLIKIMTHPFVMKPSQFKKNEWIEMDKIVPSMYLPFMLRNLPKSLKDKLDRPKGKFIRIWKVGNISWVFRFHWVNENNKIYEGFHWTFLSLKNW